MIKYRTIRQKKDKIEKFKLEISSDDNELIERLKK